MAQVLPLEEEVRSGESTSNLVLLLRGGEDDAAKIVRQAERLASLYTYGGMPARGVSLFVGPGECGQKWPDVGERCRGHSPVPRERSQLRREDLRLLS